MFCPLSSVRAPPRAPAGEQMVLSYTQQAEIVKLMMGNLYNASVASEQAIH